MKGWWSHDIGGHMFGYKDDELATRWLQLGVYSPILRLHSNCNAFNTKEPWTFNMEARSVMNEALRFRHRLLPYLYTMNVRAARDREPLVQPMYWAYPDNQDAYQCPNQFQFGSQLIVAPITAPRDQETRLGRVKAWIPPGRHVDIFTGAAYDGDRKLWLARPLDKYPVLAREGAIIPLDTAQEPPNGGSNPDGFEILVVVGNDGQFEMLEDDGNGVGINDVQFNVSCLKFSQSSGSLTIQTASNQGPRRWKIRFLALDVPSKVGVTVNGSSHPFDVEKSGAGTVVALRQDVLPGATIEVSIDPHPQLSITSPEALLHPILNGFQSDFTLKEHIWDAVTAKVPLGVKIGKLQALELKEPMLNAVLEVLIADSRHVVLVRLASDQSR